MKKINLILTVFCLLLTHTACTHSVPQKDYDVLMAEYKVLKAKNEELNSKCIELEKQVEELENSPERLLSNLKSYLEKNDFMRARNIIRILQQRYPDSQEAAEIEALKEIYQEGFERLKRLETPSETSSLTSNKFQQSQIPRYSIIKTNESRDLVDKIEYIVRIYTELDKGDLELIAGEIKQKERKYKLIFISYYLPDQQVGYGSWALTRISNGQYSTQINGVPKSNIPDTGVDGEIVGIWIDQIIGARYTIYKKGKKHFFKNSYSDGSGDEDELIIKKVGGVSRYYYKDEDRRYEYYVINGGYLYIYDDLNNVGGKYSPAN
jgi:Uncharacterized conserved protein